ncbi:MAG: hypothetical protein HY903_22720 [Deltaproteobacteria bacterium]|nr:hypothetical protein [Deltaproteobacteria bacterium]
MTVSEAKAASVLVFDTGGSGSGATADLVANGLKTALGGASMARKSRPRSWKNADLGNAKKLAEAAKNGGAAVGVDSFVQKQGQLKILQVLAVTPTGDVVFNKAARLPKKKPESVVRGVATDLGRAVAERLGSGAPRGDESPRPESPGLPQRAVLEDPEGKDTKSAVPVVASSPHPVESVTATPEAPASKRQRGGALHAAVRLTGGIVGQNDSVATPIQGGDLKISIAPTPVVGGGLEVAFANLVHLDVAARRFASGLKHESQDNPVVSNVQPATIKTTGLGGTALLSSGMEVGPMVAKVTLGVGYDKLSASKQTLANSSGGTDVVVLVPAWTCMRVLVGATGAYGDFGSRGLAAQLTLLAAPWGTYGETPLTSGASASLLGMQTNMRVRYQMPELLAGAAGVFGELAGQVDYVRIQFKGNGTRKAIITGTPVQASKESRLGFGVTLGAGVFF